ncbi:hypothetical protein AGMMS50268_08870 [Spirochaetia bacterium]|nr:hypothetical protein AGMMS49546_02040 [Spirochaetia bacterium]GHV90384.1 hypothetical protein AGMMS50268_08870 [Spirochaetia bacterium]
MVYGIIAREKGKDVHYSITWSPLSRADRWAINTTVPAIAGVYEIYWMDDHDHLRMLSVGVTHYGGLRSELRRLTDPELIGDGRTRKILEDEEIWFRYAPSNSAPTMADVVWFFRKTYFPENPGVDHSGRYEKIYMNESAPDKLIWVP